MKDADSIFERKPESTLRIVGRNSFVGLVGFLAGACVLVADAHLDGRPLEDTATPLSIMAAIVAVAAALRIMSELRNR